MTDISVARLREIYTPGAGAGVSLCRHALRGIEQLSRT